MATIHKENGGLLKYTIASPVSTGVDYNNINSSLIENRQKRDGNVGTSRYSIGPQPEYAFPPKGNFPGITKEVNDIMLDAVTGSSSALKLLRPAVGRVVTNLVKPVSYSAGEKFDIIKDAYKEKGIKGLLKSIIDDKPIYDLSGATAPREVPYRQMFDLKPRHSTPAYANIDEIIKQNKSGSFDIVNTTSFNPNTVMGHRQLRDVISEIQYPTGFKQGGAFSKPKRAHNVMGQFDNKGLIDYYKDRWDFDFNPGEIKGLLGKGNKLSGDLMSSILLRKLASSVTNPMTIKGTVPKNIVDEVTTELYEKMGGY